MEDKDMTYTNKEATPNGVGVTDELGVNMLKKQLLNFYAERDAFVQGKEQATKNLENFEKQWNIDKRLYELQMENWGLLDEKKTHKIHLIDEYWELAKEQFYYSKVRPDTFQSEKLIEGYKDEIITADKRLQSIAEEILNIKKQLIDLGESLPEDPKEVPDNE